MFDNFTYYDDDDDDDDVNEADTMMDVVYNGHPIKNETFSIARELTC